MIIWRDKWNLKEGERKLKGFKEIYYGFNLVD